MQIYLCFVCISAAMCGLGEVFEFDGRYGDALRCYKHALHLEPANADVLLRSDGFQSVCSVSLRVGSFLSLSLAKAQTLRY